jgi:UDP-N-acetylglucosamine 2-epimerase (non-hydrolysing)
MTKPPADAASTDGGRARVLTLFGTRPEVIKLAPVIAALEARPASFETLNVASGQHTDLLHPFARELRVRVDCDLRAGEAARGPLDVLQRLLGSTRELLERTQPQAVLVQGDTTTALAGALAGFYSRVPVGHVEAGLRSGDIASPFPEELNRQVITRASSFHFAATRQNRDCLLREGVAEDRIALTGNPVVDAVQETLRNASPSPRAAEVLEAAAARRLLLLSTHRRESFGAVMAGRLRALREFVARHDDVFLVFPVHPNPAVRDSARAELGGVERVLLIEPLGYADFVHLLRRAWLIVSDSGGVQEEAPSVGRPLLVIRDRTERPEVVEAGFARLIGESADALAAALEDCHADLGWFERAARGANPFGDGRAGAGIADALARFLGRRNG